MDIRYGTIGRCKKGTPGHKLPIRSSDHLTKSPGSRLQTLPISQGRTQGSLMGRGGDDRPSGTTTISSRPVSTYTLPFQVPASSSLFPKDSNMSVLLLYFVLLPKPTRKNKTKPRKVPRSVRQHKPNPSFRIDTSSFRKSPK